MKKIVFCFILGLIIRGMLFAGSGGTTLADFLKLGINARPVSMGSAFTAVADDIHSVYWNPAGLMNISEREISASHLGYVALINYDNLQYAQPLRNGAFGCDIRLLHTREERRDSLGNKTGTFRDYNSAITFSYANKFFKEFFYGVSLKIIHMKLDTEQGRCIAFDYGMLYKLTNKITTGLEVENIGLKMKLAGDYASLPLSFKLGLSYKAAEKLLVATDINVPLPGEFSVCLGAEFKPLYFLSVRSGYKFRETGNMLGGADGLTSGLGFIMKNYVIDYTYVPFGNFADTHRVSLKINL